MKSYTVEVSHDTHPDKPVRVMVPYCSISLPEQEQRAALNKFYSLCNQFGEGFALELHEWNEDGSGASIAERDV